MSWWKRALARVAVLLGRAAVEEFQQHRDNPGNKAKKGKP